MTDSDGTTLGVDLGLINTQLADRVQGLGGESLVDFPDVNVRDGHVKLLEELGDSNRGTDTHLVGSTTRNGSTNPAALDLRGQAELGGGRTAHEQSGSGTVADLGAVSSGTSTGGRESGLQASHLLNRDVGADTVILGDGDLLGRSIGVLGVIGEGLDGDDFLVEQTGVLGGSSLLVGLGSERVLVSTGDTVARSDVLGGDTHGHDAVAGVLGVRLLQLGPENGGDGAGAIVSGHGLHSTTDTDVNRSRADSVSNCGDSSQTGGALSVDRVERHAVREAGVDLSHTASLRTTEFLENGTDSDIVDESRVEVRVRLQSGPEDVSEQLFGIGVLETALLRTSNRGTEGRKNDNVRGRLLEDLAQASRNWRGHDDGYCDC